jgi:HEAT repeat protein
MRSTILSALAVAALFFTTGSPEGAEKKRPKQRVKKAALVNAPSRTTQIGGKSLDQWIADLKDKDPSVQENAIRTILLFGETGREAVPKFIQMAKGRYPIVVDVSTKVNVAIALGVLGLPEEDRTKGVTLLCNLLMDSQAVVRLHAALALSKIGSDANTPTTIRRLLLKLRDPTTWEIRKACAMALGRVAIPPDKNTPPQAEVITKLVKALRIDRSHQVRVEICQSLIILGPPENSTLKNRVVDALARCAGKDPRKLVRIWAEVGVLRMSKLSSKAWNNALKAIGSYLKDPILGNRCNAARALGAIGPDAKSQVPKLIKALDDKEPIMVSWTLWALVEMEQKAKPALPKLEIMVTKTKDPTLKKSIKDAIQTIRYGKNTMKGPDGKKKK